MIEIRPAVEDDAAAIRDIFQATYGEDYTYRDFYDLQHLKKLIYSDDTLVLVAEDPSDGVVGTASVVLESGAYTDLVGEFGRLAVHPKAWGRGLGRRLLEERLWQVQDRLHVGYMEARVVRHHSLIDAGDHGFSPVGFLPLKLRFGARRESTALLIRYFGEALALRRNHPRIVPEVYPLAGAAMAQVGLELDVVVDEESASYPEGDEYSLHELTATGYAALLRIERGRLRRREVFGPLRLHYGFFKLQAGHSNYLLARRDGLIAAALGFTVDRDEGNVRIFELIHLDDGAIRCLLAELERRGREELGASCIEIDVGADAPRMQRTLLELGYLPVAYVPALAFHQVERRDVVKMERLLVPFELGAMDLVSPTREIAELVIRSFELREVLPRIGEVVHRGVLFSGLNAEQLQRLAALCRPVTFEVGEQVFADGDSCSETYLLLDGEVAVEVGDRPRPVGTVGPGECLGEVALLTGTAHSARATVTRAVRAAVLTRADIVDLVRRRPDIGVVLYRNLAKGLGEKLRRTDLAGLPASS